MAFSEMVGHTRLSDYSTARRHDGEIVVVGGTYVDRVSMLRNEPVAGHTTEIESTEEVLGGPGLCLALAMRRLGARVTLATAIGDCAASDRARDLMRDNGVDMLASTTRIPLDRSDLYLSPSGDRVVFNTHAISRSAPYARLAAPALGGARVIVIGSPTPLREAEEIIAAARQDTLIVALLHSRQLREITAARRAILDAAHVVCVSAGDAALLRGNRPGPHTALLTTMGEEGAHIRLDDVELVIPQPNVVETRQTNGAGEAFCAGLTVALAGSRRAGDGVPSLGDVRSAVELGQGYAATHLQAGGNLAFPELDLARMVTRGPLAVLAG